jgi:hypothetical protein
MRPDSHADAIVEINERTQEAGVNDPRGHRARAASADTSLTIPGGEVLARRRRRILRVDIVEAQRDDLT